MKLTQAEMLALSAVALISVYFLYKTRDVSKQFEAAYNSLANQVASGTLKYTGPNANDLKM